MYDTQLEILQSKIKELNKVAGIETHFEVLTNTTDETVLVTNHCTMHNNCEATNDLTYWISVKNALVLVYLLINLNQEKQ